jgi:hypothetical protein
MTETSTSISSTGTIGTRSAGLLDNGFDPFWRKFERVCRIPTVIWRIGLCLGDSGTGQGVDRHVFTGAAAKCSLVNFRDDLTADYYDVADATICPCLTIAYLEGLVPDRLPVGRGVLYSSHEKLVSDSEREQIR